MGLFVNSGLIYCTIYAMIGANHDMNDGYTMAGWDGEAGAVSALDPSGLH